MCYLMLRKLITGLRVGALTPALLLLCLLPWGTATADKPPIDPSYADGKTYYMIGPHVITNPNPQLYAQAEELYLIAYPINPSGTDTDPKTLPSGYQPLCNPCYHFGAPDPGAYHDHVLTGAPGLGKNGTAGEYKSPWKIILLVYTLAAVQDPNFKPITSADDVDAAEAACAANAAACIFQKQNQPGNPNPYEVETGLVLICPFVAPEA
jgi:hypothetical protein